VIFNSGHKETLPLHINTEVVDPPFNTRKGNVRVSYLDASDSCASTWAIEITDINARELRSR